MKKTILLSLALALLLTLGACGEAPAEAGATPTPTFGMNQPDATLPGGDGASGAPSPGQTHAGASPEVTRSTTYGPSIFVIEASGSWQDELAEGYYANYECEFYLDRIEPYEMYADTGTYQGVFWIKATIDADDFIKDMIKNVPGLSVIFDVSAEAMCENLSFYLRDGYTRNNAPSSYQIPNGEDGFTEPEHAALADNGSFVTVTTAGDFTVLAQDFNQGITLSESESVAGATQDVSYVIHVEPDPNMDKTVRKVTIYITAGNTAHTLEGTLTRLPGYPEDLQKYNDANAKNDFLNGHKPS